MKFERDLSPTYLTYGSYSKRESLRSTLTVISLSINYSSLVNINNDYKV